MAYRRTPRTAARLRTVRERILAATLELVAADGWAAASVTAVAAAAGVATGSIYRHVESKDALFAEVFRRVAGRELERVRAAAAPPGPAAVRLEAALRVFAERALRSRRLAYALLAEPAGAAVEVERLAFRAGYRRVFRDVLADGLARGELDRHDPDVAAAVLTGAMGEALVGPLAPAATVDDAGAVVDALVACCLRAVPVAVTPAPEPPEEARRAAHA